MKLEAMRQPARRAFVALWILLGLLGALDHTIAIDLFGRRFDLLLPNLKYGYVMFNQNLRTVQVYQYARADGVRHDLSDLVKTPSPGYHRARVAMDVLQDPEYLAEICYRATLASPDPLTIYVSEYQVDKDPRQPSRTSTLRCDAHGLAPQ